MDEQKLLLIQKDDKFYHALIFIGVIFVAFNLRPAITSIGPLIGTIRDDIGFSNWSVALLTSLPLIAFAIMSPIAPKLANKLSNEMTLVLGLFILILGICLRSISIVFLIFFGTFLVGLGIAICNVLLPGVIKEKFPAKIAIMTSIYTTSMAIFATSASGISVPLSEGLGLGWQVSLLVWIIPAIIGLFVWLIVYTKNKRKKMNEQARFFETKTGSGIWKSSLAWKVALFMGFQSLIFYVTISWLPELLMDRGMEKVTAGYMLSYFQFLGIPVSFIIPIIAVKMKTQRLLVIGINMFYIIGILILLNKPSFVLIMIAITLIGIASSANFALSLSFLTIRAKNARDAAELSGMAQSMGYLLAAIGPIFIGYLYDLTHAWTIPLIILIVITCIIIYVGMSAGQNKYVLE
ncbi:MFS transporter [Pseudogracilibacillus sp. SE30717A]|uniref:CynX/NimT family MFS transporter n=1 Tax=Pseudogracilibacillus sp. SE30717A TaxID=3098293 RepID=UPI00300DC5FD